MAPLTRREFLKSCGAGAGAVAASQLAGLSPAQAATANCLWGAFPDPAAFGLCSDPNSCTPDTYMPAVRQFEALIGRPIAMTRHYPRWDYPIPNPVIKESSRTGHVPFIAWKPQRLNDSWLTWADIANGKYDARINKVATNLAAWNRNAYFVFHHEPENAYHSGHGGTREEFKAAYDHIVDRFNAAGAVKIRHVCTLQRVTYDGKNGGADLWFPDTATALAVDGYNRGSCGGDKLWHSFEELFSSAHDYAVLRGHNMFVQEFGSVENDSVCGVEGVRATKAGWITAAGNTIRSWPEVKGVIYTHSEAEFRTRIVDFRVNTSQAALDAYKAVGSLPYFS